MTTAPFDPLDYQNLTVNLVRELMQRGPFHLPLQSRFEGPGVYALFYTGNSDRYAPIRSADASRPIYVGKAIPPGGRKGNSDKGNNTSNPSLFKRLGEHASSLEAANNLSISDFKCRFIVLVPLWITMAERFLIDHYTPPWNVCIEGFGLHNPGKGRHAGEVSWWDTLHPGRSWAKNLKPRRTQEEADQRLREFLDQQP